ncbi:uncharacterized protein K452DRAFT_362400 [Aplosporella prunicola CBS 121167]|uniref:Uncharacterized protein n=1 Tax=Aplosporella prunicola CBS 121167 TaxID=1176127 RepID=A0A6A6AXY1_9PEZI|nr:uncharacterized protein K452DRAFT_362400 [Aplosporella prunicola CBS 121167]KAF2136640.1 hypothetical protein K452DRAFT_362400 [Aplosporella prunicola CBS 121167]
MFALSENPRTDSSFLLDSFFQLTISPLARPQSLVLNSFSVFTVKPPVQKTVDSFLARKHVIEKEHDVHEGQPCEKRLRREPPQWRFDRPLVPPKKGKLAVFYRPVLQTNVYNCQTSQRRREKVKMMSAGYTYSQAAWYSLRIQAPETFASHKTKFASKSSSSRKHSVTKTSATGNFFNVFKATANVKVSATPEAPADNKLSVTLNTPAEVIKLTEQDDNDETESSASQRLMTMDIHDIIHPPKDDEPESSVSQHLSTACRDTGDLHDKNTQTTRASSFRQPLTKDVVLSRKSCLSEGGQDC